MDNFSYSSQSVDALRRQCIQAALDCNALRFSVDGFRLKSGRVSPYFFDASRLFNGKVLYLMMHTLSEVMYDEKRRSDDLSSDKLSRYLPFGALFGPAYKGIPLASTLAAVQWTVCGQSFQLSFDRKEMKEHGEGGEMFGPSIQGTRTLIVEDVITAGTSFRHSVDLIQKNGGMVSGLAVLLDRQEYGVEERVSVVQRIRDDYHIPVFRLFTFSDFIDFVKQEEVGPEILERMYEYRSRYGT